MTRWTRWKATLGAMGFVLGVAGMAWERRVLVGIAVALLGVAFLLRFVERRPQT